MNVSNPPGRDIRGWQSRSAGTAHLRAFNKSGSPARVARLHQLTLASLMLPFIALAGDAQARSPCPKPATQVDVLNLRPARLKAIRITDQTKKTVAKIYACHPPHPVFGGPALIRFQDVRSAPNGLVLLRFQVVGLSDILLAYYVDHEGNLLRAFVTAP